MSSNEVVVGVDGSETSVGALRWALQHAQRTGSTVVAVHAWQYPFSGDLTGSVPLPDRRVIEEGAEATLTHAIEKADIPGSVRVVTEVIDGQPASRLIERASDAELLVVGARGHGGFMSLLLGSVATQCVNHATVPVVVVPPVGDAQ